MPLTSILLCIVEINQVGLSSPSESITDPEFPVSTPPGFKSRSGLIDFSANRISPADFIFGGVVLRNKDIGHFNSRFQPRNNIDWSLVTWSVRMVSRYYQKRSITL